MPTSKSGKRLLGLLDKTAKDIVGKSFSDIASERNHKPVILIINSKKKRLEIAVGDLKATTVQLLTDPKKFANNDGGMRASSDKWLNINDDPIDVFLLNKDHISKGEALKPLLAHEIAHYIEQTGIVHPDIDDVDRHNAGVVLDSFDENVRSCHTQEWAELLCMAARRLAKQRKVSHSTVRAFLEAAIPPYDRPHWDGRQIKEAQ
jgi:hypothetical protein